MGWSPRFAPLYYLLAKCITAVCPKSKNDSGGTLLNSPRQAAGSGAAPAEMGTQPELFVA